MVGITDHPGFLYSCKQQGCDVVVLPMMFLEGIYANPVFFCKRLDILFDNDRGFDFRPVIVQLIGNDITTVKEVIAILESYDIQGLNLNMGCPSSRIKMQGLGASILEHPKERDALIDAVLKYSSRPVSIKMRLFGKEQPDMAMTIGFCQSLKDKNIDWVAIHGRTGQQGYKGAANWDAIKAVHEATDVFLVGNGDIKNHACGKARVDKNYCDAFMIGRAAMKDPRVFSMSYNPAVKKTMKDARQLFSDIMAFIVANKHRGLEHLLLPHEIRKWAIYFSSNIPGGKRLRERAVKSNTIEDLAALFVEASHEGP
ncbi:MAG: tRNA dihydrouridine synthase [Candidatus Sigynarchaeum springense]